MPNTQIHYIATKANAIKLLQEYCAKEQIDLVPYAPESMEHVRYLLLIEPIEIGAELFALSTVWKPWLMKHRPEIRLFFAGFSRSSHLNYLNLLDLPATLKSKLNDAYPVNAYPLQYVGVKERNKHKYDQYEDPWNRFMPLTGREMKKQMLKFTDGHDQINSFSNQTSRLRKALIDIHFLLNVKRGNKSEHSTLEQDIEQCKADAVIEWNYLKLRWDFYKKYFEWMPFQDTAKAIIQNMKDLEHAMNQIQHTGNYPDSAIVDKLILLVKDGLKYYINIEEHW